MYAVVFDFLDLEESDVEKQRRYVLTIRNDVSLEDYTTKAHNVHLKKSGKVILRAAYLDDLLCTSAYVKARAWQSEYGGVIHPNHSKRCSQIFFYGDDRQKAVDLMNEEDFIWD